MHDVSSNARFRCSTASGDTASPLFVQAKLHQAALGIVFSDYAVAEQAAREAISTASATLGPRSSEVATGLQLLSHVYTLTQRRELAVEPARRSFEIALEIHARDATHPKVMESTLYYAQALQCSRGLRRGGCASTGIFRPSRPACSVTTAGRSGNRSRPLFPLDIEIGDLKVAIANARRAIEIYFKEGEAWIRHSRRPGPQAGERAPCGAIEQRSGRAARGGRSSVGCGEVGTGRVACARELRSGAGVSGAF